MDMFVPRLSLCRHVDGKYTLEAATPTPSGCFSAGPALVGVPAGVTTIPELVPIQLLLQHSGSFLCTSQIKIVRHRVENLVLDDTHRAIATWSVLNGQVLGSAGVRRDDPSVATCSTSRPLSNDRNWHAWAETSGKPAELHVHGDLEMPTPGYAVRLTRKAPQGINQSQLLLDLSIGPPTRPVPQVVTRITVTYHEDLTDAGQ